jgi:hypothetical protein
MCGTCLSVNLERRRQLALRRELAGAFAGAPLQLAASPGIPRQFVDRPRQRRGIRHGRKAGGALP